MFGWTDAEEEAFHRKLCLGIIWSAPVIFLFLYFVFPPNWGKTYKTLLGPTIPPRLGWCLFEIPNLYWAVICYSYSPSSISTANTFLLALFVGHYFNRSVIYPLTLNPQTKRIPLEIALSAMLYTNMNGYIQSQSLCKFENNSQLGSPFFLLGVAVFFTGVAINWHSDHILRHLRKGSSNNKKKDDDDDNKSKNKTSGGYLIPYGGFFAYVSAPHYFGEIVEWTGFALAGQSLAAWSFAVFTCANLIPRAVAHHQWYLDHFQEDYPRQRKAVIPFLW